MSDDFRRAFLRHLDEHDVGFSELARATGVSRDVLNKLRARPGSSTTVENGLLIAAYFGKTLNEFVALQTPDRDERLKTLFAMLSPEEKQLVEAQMRGLVASHGKQ